MTIRDGADASHARLRLPPPPTQPVPGGVGQFLLQGPPNEIAKTISLPPPWTRYGTVYGKHDATIGTACTATYQCTTSGTMTCAPRHYAPRCRPSSYRRPIPRLTRLWFARH